MDIPEALLKRNESLAPYTYMKVGGPANYCAVVSTTDELVACVTAAIDSKTRFIVLGGGSNTIFSDAGYRGLVIINRANSVSIDKDSKLVISESGATTNMVVNKTTMNGLAGLEEFLGVPGTIGGAVYNNSHYLNHLIGDYVSKVELFSITTKQRKWVEQIDLHFAYDYSILHDTHDIVLSVEFKLTANDSTQLQQHAKTALERRKNSQPLNLPSSGCMFQNFKDKAALYPQLPSGITSAGALIDAAGLKGLKIGGAEVSSVHANFIVNTGNATTQDIIDLSNQIITIIQQKFGITLQREVFFIDEYGERTNP